MNNIQKNTKSNHKLIGILVILATATALLLPPTIAYVSNQNNDKQAKQDTANSQVYTDQAKCLNEAYNDYQGAWKAADKDGDGNVKYSDGATDVTTSYYDGAISCYWTYRTDNSESNIADYQAKRQQEVDKYTAWLDAMKQAIYVPSNNNDYRSSMSCRSNAIGYSVYTTCD